MKGIIEFDLPEERDSFELAQAAWKYQAVVDDLFRYLRDQLKHHARPEVEDKVLEEVREKLVECMQSYDLPL